MLQSEKEVVMILFDKDWQEQGAVIHYSTCNQSFIKMHILLKRMGIKNNTYICLDNKSMIDNARII